MIEITPEVFPLNQNSFKTEKYSFFKVEYLFKIECENHALTGVVTEATFFILIKKCMKIYVF